MKTIGETLKEKRKEKNLSLADLEKETKIKPEFIKAIELGKWEDLPERPVVSGFVKNIAESLGMDTKQAAAIFRRDYPPDKNLRINPKPDLTKKFKWSPRLTFFVGVFAIFLVTISYLALQYMGFVSPPTLLVNSPEENQVVNERMVVVSGSTDPEAQVLVNNQPVIVEKTGEFRTEVEIFEGTEEIVVKAVSRSGKETVVTRKIEPELEN